MCIFLIVYYYRDTSRILFKKVKESFQCYKLVCGVQQGRMLDPLLYNMQVSKYTNK